MRALHRYGLSTGLVAAAVVTVLGTGALVEAFLWPSSAPAPAPRPSGPAAAPSPAGRPDAVAQQIGSAPAPPPSSSGAPPRPAGSVQSRTAAVPLTARFTRGPDGGLAGYPATVTVANQGTVAVSGWTVTLTLPRATLAVTDVEGATVTRDGAVWTFIPTAATAKVGPAGSVTVSFRVSGAALLDADPTACRIDTNPCQGVG